MKRPIPILLTVAAACLPALAQEQTRRASIRNIGGDWGKCTIEVEVDDVAEVAISGDVARLRTLGGQPARWRRFECSGPIPARPAEFRFRGIDGRGRVELIREPRDNRGVAVVRIEDRKGGREGYTFDLEWRGGDMGRGGGRGDDRGSANMGQTIQSCQDAVADRLAHDGYRDARFRTAAADDRRGRDDRVGGTLTARDGRGNYDFDYSCSVDLRSGRIRDVDVKRR